LIPRELVGVMVFQRKSDGYFDATAMCKAVGKARGSPAVPAFLVVSR
jgi:hypothetical protein